MNYRVAAVKDVNLPEDQLQSLLTDGLADIVNGRAISGARIRVYKQGNIFLGRVEVQVGTEVKWLSFSRGTKDGFEQSWAYYLRHVIASVPYSESSYASN